MKSNVALSPLSVTYAAVTKLRTAAYRKGIFKTAKLPVPVISVGNLTVGGTGKTPLVANVSRTLAEIGRKVCVLTRGYKRANANLRFVVSDGTTVVADVRQAGDEPLWLAEDLRGVAAVICDRDRVAAGEWAISNLGSNAFVLDDGFQHLQLARDLNILAIDATDPWGGGHLLPFGRLRESRKGATRADCAIITRAEQAPNLTAIRDEVQDSIGSRPVFVSLMQAKGVRELLSQIIKSPETIPQPVAAFCAIGNPNSFFEQLRQNKISLARTQSFPDHHSYQQAEIQELSGLAKQRGAVSLITTAKDAVKLRELEFDLPCYVLEVELLIDRPEELQNLIRGAIEAS